MEILLNSRQKLLLFTFNFDFIIYVFLILIYNFQSKVCDKKGHTKTLVVLTSLRKFLNKVFKSTFQTREYLSNLTCFTHLNKIYL